MTETMTTERYVSESLVYERAQSTVSAMMNGLAKQRNENEREARRSGTEPDKSFQLVIDVLSDAKKRFRKESKRLWKLAEKSSDIHEIGVENLCNAIIQRAALDYEAALSGHGNVEEKRRIEAFAEDGADDYTSIDFQNVLDRIRVAQPVFSKTAKEHIEEIMSETKNNKQHDGDNRKNTYRCPLCGGGLYAYGKPDGGIQQIRCTGCNLFELVRLKKKDSME